MCVSHGQSVSLLGEGRASEGDEANGQTHLLSLLLPVAIAEHRWHKTNPPPGKIRTEGGDIRKGGKDVFSN